MITETSLVSAVVSRIVADNSRIVPIKMKHQVAITFERRRGAVMVRSVFMRVAPRIRPASSSSTWILLKAEESC